VGSCEHGNEPSGFTKGREFIDYQTDCQLLKKDSVPCSCLVMFRRNVETLSVPVSLSQSVLHKPYIYIARRGNEPRCTWSKIRSPAAICPQDHKAVA
jgi:hypothetical protein